VDPGGDVLVERIKVGDEEALAEAFDRYGPLVYGLARRVTGNEGTAEDVTQEVFTTLWCQPERFDATRGSLRAFLGVQAHRRAVDAVRRETRRTARENRTVELNPITLDHPADELEAASVAAAVRDAIARLPGDQRRAVELAYFQGCTQREVATVLGIPEGTAKSRLRLAQAKLGEWLGPLVLEMA